MLLKEPARIEVYNDIDGAIVNYFRVLRDPKKAKKLQRALELTLFSRAEFVSAWERSDCEIEEARRLVVRCFQGIGAKGSLVKNGWRTRTAKCIWSPCVAWNGWPHQVPAFTARLKDVIIEQLPWQRILEIYDDAGALIYLDPPYPRDTRDRDHRTIYANELSDADHDELCHRARDLKGMVLLSSYPNPIYERVLEGWTLKTVASRAQNNAKRIECLWLNPAIVDRLEALHA